MSSADKAISDRIEYYVQMFGSLREAASMLEIDVGYLSRLSSGKKCNPSAEVLEKLGLERVVTYVPIVRNYVATPLQPRTKCA